MYKEFVDEALKEASHIAREMFGKVNAMTKESDNNQVVTEADYAIGTFLIAKIRASFPEHNIIDEEAGVMNHGSDFTWVVDPIDGTSNFASGCPLFGVMLGLLKDGRPIAGGLALPAFSEIYSAGSGEGAFCNGKRVSVTSETDLMKVLVAYGIDGRQDNPEFTFNEFALLARLVLKIRNIRTSNCVFDTAMVIKGSYGAFINRTSKVWDNVAQQVIVEEAGGVYTDFYGNPPDYSNALSDPEATFSFIAAPAEIHAKIMEVLHPE